MNVRAWVCGAALALVAAALCWADITPGAAGALRRSPAMSVDQVVEAVAALAAWCCLLWLSIGWLALLASSVPGRVGSALAGVADAVTPALLRRAAGLLVGGAVAVVPGAPAAAGTTAPAPPPVPARSTVSLAAADLDWPVDRAAPRPGVVRPVVVRPVVVRPGDSLWRIAQRHIRTRSPAAVAAAWPHWYAANRSVIGPNPDLLRPGLVLVPPSDT